MAVVALNQQLVEKIAVLGLGLTGLSVVRFLIKQNFNVVVFDSREAPPAMDILFAEFPTVPLIRSDFSSPLTDEYSQLVISPGLSPELAMISDALARDIDVIGDIELFARYIKAPIVAITGSNGKSTVTSMVYSMAKKAGLSAAIGGNIGTPVLDLLDQQQQYDVFVLELSSFQLELVSSLRPRVGVVLNISADHMDRYPSLAAYASTKAKLYQSSQTCVINKDDSWVIEMAGDCQSSIFFSESEPENQAYGIRNIDGIDWLAKGQKNLISSDELCIVGTHNLTNALAALALADVLGLPLEAALDALREFQGLAHRSEFVIEKCGVKWFNDSKGTNVGATIAALNGLPGSIVLIAGGVSKGADFSSLRDVVKEKVKAVVLIGEDAPKIARVMRGVVPLFIEKNMAAAVNRANGIAAEGDSVLLSPACASFDMYDNYQHRGNVFKTEVRAMVTVK